MGRHLLQFRWCFGRPESRANPPCLASSIKCVIRLTLIFIFLELINGSAVAEILLPPTSSAVPEVRVTLKDEPLATDSAGTDSSWSVNAWDGATFKLRVMVDKHGPHGTPAAARLFRLEGRGGGDAHLIVPVRLNVGQRYEASLWLRALEDAKVSIGFRRDVPYYEYFAFRTFDVTPTWQHIVISGRFAGPEALSGSLRLISQSLGKDILIAGLHLDAITDNPFRNAALNQPPPPTFAGMLVNKLGRHDTWPAMNPKIIRLWDTQTSWADIAKAPNLWNFQRISLYLEYAKRNHADILLTLGQTPDWAVSSALSKCTYGLGCSPPRSEQDWRRYIQELHTRFGNNIRYFELWNEPDYRGFWAGSPEQMAELALAVREETKQLNQPVYLMGPGITATAGLPFLDRYLAAGGGQPLDAISFHAYFAPSGDGLVENIDNIRTTLLYHGLSLPLWNTEGAPSCGSARQFCNDSSVSETDRLSANFKAMLIMRALGVSSFSYYNFEIPWPEARIVSQDDVSRLTEAGRAYLQALSFIRNAIIVDAYVYQKVVVIRFLIGGFLKTAIWSNDGDVMVTIPRHWQVGSATFWQGAQIEGWDGVHLSAGRRPIIVQ